MTTAGLLSMLISVGTVCLLFFWCIWKVMSTPNETEKVHGVEFQTPDMNEE
jgi:hypothetical protein